jgi:site-specific DNA recombinase
MSQRAAFYVRVATTCQGSKQAVTSQLEAMERAASAMGLTVPLEQRYIDEGVSGLRLHRPGLDALRDAAADGLLDIVFVVSPDRLTRNDAHQHLLIDELRRKEVEVHFVEQPMKASDRYA